MGVLVLDLAPAALASTVISTAIPVLGAIGAEEIEASPSSPPALLVLVFRLPGRVWSACLEVTGHV